MKLREAVMGANASVYYKVDITKIRGAFYPRTEEEVVEVIRQAREKGFSVTPKGGGSGLSGACTGGNRDRVMISTLQMRQILCVSKDQGYVDVQAGATPDEINAVLSPIGMKFYVAPSSRDVASVGGLLSTDGGGNDAWTAGTMRDNTLRAKMVLYNGHRVTVDRSGVRCDDPALESALNGIGFSLDDVAGSHGTLGFITELRLVIKPTVRETLVGGTVHYSDGNEMGQSIARMIDRKIPITYGEVIYSAHDDVRGDLRPPLMIIELPQERFDDLKQLVDLKRLSGAELSSLKDIRLKLPKRNPKTGLQMAIFEDYGFHGRSLQRMQDCIEDIDRLLVEHRFTPFAKYGHAPSKWYLGNNRPAYGVILHSREIRPEGGSGEQIFKTVLDIVDLCRRLEITPKPEHKWPYDDVEKNRRLMQIREIIGTGFNDFVLSPDYASVLGSMV
ncbi:MAG: FAD-binding oxidoreductase [Candidatus Thorarchaeota archaeon]